MADLESMLPEGIKINEEIGHGSFGVVYSVFKEGEIKALKIISSNARGLLENRIACELDHLNIITSEPIEIKGDYKTGILMDYIPKNLEERIKDDGIDQNLAVKYVKGIARGLSYLHKHGIIHRDLKPQNVLMNGQRPVITDFGLVKIQDMSITKTGQFVGTPMYSAPEQADDAKRVGEPADIYSLGGIFYKMLTGENPVNGNQLEIFSKLSNERNHRILNRRRRRTLEIKRVPKKLVRTVMKMLEFDPKKRYNSAAAVIKELKMEKKRQGRIYACASVLAAAAVT